jgi:hypothetical protein
LSTAVLVLATLQLSEHREIELSVSPAPAEVTCDSVIVWRMHVVDDAVFDSSQTTFFVASDDLEVDAIVRIAERN